MLSIFSCDYWALDIFSGEKSFQVNPGLLGSSLVVQQVKDPVQVTAVVLVQPLAWELLHAKGQGVSLSLSFYGHAFAYGSSGLGVELEP